MTPRTINADLPSLATSTGSSSNQKEMNEKEHHNNGNNSLEDHDNDEYGDDDDVHRLLVLPKRYRLIPKGIQSLVDCAANEIKELYKEVEIEGFSSSEEDESALDDGFFLCDVNVIRRKLLVWYKMFPHIKPFFAVKCHPDMMVTAVLGRYRDQCGFDCASISEIQLAIASCLAGGDTFEEASRRCIYANPQRDAMALQQSLKLGVGVMTFDGIEELTKIRMAYDQHLKQWEDETNTNHHNQTRDASIPGSSRTDDDNDNDNDNDKPRRPEPPEMILRLLVPDDHSSVPLGEKFGAPPSRVKELALECIHNAKLPLIGVSFHCGSGNHDPVAYQNAIQIAHESIETINTILEQNNLPKCSILDIGGGYPGVDGCGGDHDRFCYHVRDEEQHDDSSSHTTSDNPQHHNPEQVTTDESAHHIASVVTPLVDNLFQLSSSSNNNNGLRVIAEPGRYFVEEAFALCSRIYSKRIEVLDVEGLSSQSVRYHYYIAQGVNGVFKDVLLCGEDFIPIPLRMTYGNRTDDDNKNHVDSTTDNISSNSTTNVISETEETFQSTIHGPSGQSFDIVCRDVALPNLQEGDWLLFDRMGAYTVSIAAKSGSVPIRYVMGGGELVEQEILNL